MNKYLMNISMVYLLVLSTLANADTVQQSLIGDIKKAQNSLQKTEQSITEQSVTYSKKISALEKSVLQLQQQTAVARRAADEQTLSFTQLTNRLKEWQQQHTYQQNLVQRFAQQNQLSDVKNKAKLSKNLSALSKHLDQLVQRSSPTFQTISLADNNGLLREVQSLKVGPVSWYIDQEKQQGGLYHIKNNVPQAILAFEQDDSQGLVAIQKGESGHIVFDPTLDRALKIKVAEESLVDHIKKGGVWVLPILLFGVFALLISLVKGVQLWRLPTVLPALSTRLQHILAMPESNSINQELLNLKHQLKDSMQAELVNITTESDIGPSRDDQLFAALLHHKHRLDYWLGAIAITAAVAPLLGLLGTVSGMIETFKLMTLFGAGDPAAVSGGISEALVTTELGLVVAIPALLCHALLSRRAKTYYGDLESCAVQLSQLDKNAHQSLKEVA